MTGKIWIWLCISGFLWAGCSDGTGDVLPEAPVLETAVAFAGLEDVHIGKSLVFFFRKSENSDTLVYQTEIDGPSEDFARYKFNVPAGYYQMVLLGNGDSAHIRFTDGVRSLQNTVIEYDGGVEPPELYMATSVIKAGEQQAAGAGMFPLTVRVALTVRNVPAGVDQIDVDLENTSAGVTFGRQILDRVTSPGIIQSVYDVIPGSSPVVRFSSFPSVEKAGESKLLVRCYDVNGIILFRGESASFSMKGTESVSVACSFDTAAPAMTAGTKPGKEMVLPFIRMESVTNEKDGK